MASASATLCPAAFPVAAAAVTVGNPTRKTTTKVHYLTGMNSFAGLKANNCVVSMGVPVSAEQSFVAIAMSLRASSSSQGKKSRGGGGALSSTCDAAGEIFRIAAIMNGLVLVGVAVGFVLLRVEAFVEESES